jgi:N utilization substance protein B
MKGSRASSETSRRSGSAKGGRRRARELALQGLYQWLVARTPPATTRVDLQESANFAKCDAAFFDELWRGVTDEFETLIAALVPFLDRAPAQLSPIEKGILVIGAWELLRVPETPYRVAINEAVELAKAYGGTDGHKYVNGVLDKLALATRGDEVGAARAAG